MQKRRIVKESIEKQTISRLPVIKFKILNSDFFHNSNGLASNQNFILTFDFPFAFVPPWIREKNPQTELKTIFKVDTYLMNLNAPLKTKCKPNISVNIIPATEPYWSDNTYRIRWMNIHKPRVYHLSISWTKHIVDKIRKSSRQTSKAATI